MFRALKSLWEIKRVDISLKINVLLIDVEHEDGDRKDCETSLPSLTLTGLIT
jgi:hypothetical protein